jgi:glycerophosphoryl diester phosphodiesterase
LRHNAPEMIRGIVAERSYNQPCWNFLASGRRRNLAYMLHAARSRPQFIAYRVDDLPAPATTLARGLFGLPVLTWTVRSEAQRVLAARYADQMIFEGFRA